jgi:hypothetical protein
MGLEKEGGCVGHGHVEVVSVCTLDEEVMHNPLRTIGEIPCRSGQFGLFLIQVHRNKPSVEEGYSSHHPDKPPGLLLFAKEGGSRRAGRQDWDSWHFFGFFLVTCGRGFFVQRKR